MAYRFDEYIQDNPDEVEDIIQIRSQYDPATADDIIGSAMEAAGRKKPKNKGGRPKKSTKKDKPKPKPTEQEHSNEEREEETENQPGASMDDY